MGSDSCIRVLPVDVANKIAAGEVVERPASVLKELMENSLDAAATQIDVEIVAGGRKLVAVNDNGTGMCRDDAILSLERLATSKIRAVEDIERIATLGFRGEALAAISSVSRFRLVTCLAGEVVGTEIRAGGGKFQDVLDCGCPAGTTVEVRDLFFNIPARRKFLRSYQTELMHLRTHFIVEALSHSKVGMSLTVDGSEMYRLAGGATLEDRIEELFGADYRRNLRQVDYRGLEVSVGGYVSLPAMNRADRGEQYVFVNRRATSAAVITHSIREGYHTLLPNDRHASVFLFLDMDPGLVDVNVHPTKREVRFRNPGDVRDTVIAAIRQALRAHVPVGPSPEDAGFRLGAAGPSRFAPAVSSAAGPAASTVQLKIEDLPQARAFQYPRLPMAAGPPATPAPGAPPGRDGRPPESPEAGEPLRAPASPWAWCRVLGQVGSLYVMFETEDGYVVMDPHAAHERVLFERFMSEFLNGRVQTQGLLMPQTVELTPKDAALLRKALPVFKAMGFGISDFGAESFVVDALPSHFAGASAAALLIDISHGLEEAGSRGAKGRWREEAIAMAACKSAVKNRDRLTLQEIEQLVVDLARTEMPYTCPHGRPTLIFTSFKDLNRKFGRE